MPTQGLLLIKFTVIEFFNASVKRVEGTILSIISSQQRFNFPHHLGGC